MCMCAWGRVNRMNGDKEEPGHTEIQSQQGKRNTFRVLNVPWGRRGRETSLAFQFASCLFCKEPLSIKYTSQIGYRETEKISG